MIKKALALFPFVFSSELFALPPGTPVDIELFITGSSSQDIALKTVASSLCIDGPDYYSETGAIPGKNYTAIFCTTSSAQVPNLAPGTYTLLIHKRSKGDSGFTADVAAQTPITRMDVSNTSCVLFSPNHYKCTGIKSDTPFLGMSDVEPGAFRGANLLIPGVGGVITGESGTSQWTGAMIGNVTSNSVENAAALTFGVVVTKNLRDALQAVQFGLGNACIGSDEESCMPALNKPQIASLFAGSISNWSEFRDSVGDPIIPKYGNPLTSRVEICRGTQGSGMQAVANQFFLNNPCDPMVAPKADNTVASGTNGAGTYTSLIGVSGAAVHWNETAGDINICLAALNSSNNAWAIGVQSLEQINSNSAMRFIKIINDLSPLLSNVAAGKYGLLGLTSVFWYNGAPPADLRIPVATELRKRLISDTWLRQVNLSLGGGNLTIGGVPVAGKVGWSALASNGFTLNIPFDETKPVIPYSNRGVSGTSNANSCAPLLIIGGKSQI